MARARFSLCSLRPRAQRGPDTLETWLKRSSRRWPGWPGSPLAQPRMLVGGPQRGPKRLAIRGGPGPQPLARSLCFQSKPRPCPPFWHQSLDFTPKPALAKGSSTHPGVGRGGRGPAGAGTRERSRGRVSGSWPSAPWGSGTGGVVGCLAPKKGRKGAAPKGL